MGNANTQAPRGQGIAKPFDATGTYSARDMQALNATFANPEQEASSPPEKAKGAATAEQWTCGRVPPLAPMADGGDGNFCVQTVLSLRVAKQGFGTARSV